MVDRPAYESGDKKREEDPSDASIVEFCQFLFLDGKRQSHSWQQQEKIYSVETGLSYKFLNVMKDYKDLIIRFIKYRNPCMENKDPYRG